jgi:hypothetical protein
MTVGLEILETARKGSGEDKQQMLALSPIIGSTAAGVGERDPH